MQEDTVAIPVMPRPSTMVWLGASTSIAVISWGATMLSVAGVAHEASLLVICGLSVSVAATVGATIVWARYSLACQSADHQRELVHLAGGQHGLAMAEIRHLRQLVEENSGQAGRERQAMGVKLSKVIEALPDYYNGVADTVERVTGTDNVRAIARVPRHN